MKKGMNSFSTTALSTTRLSNLTCLRALLSAIVIILSVSAVSAKGFELKAEISPYSQQRITYTQYESKHRTSAYGTGFGCGVLYNVSNVISLGTDFSYGFHTFREFHNFHCFDVSALVRFNLPLTVDGKLRLGIDTGAGLSFVLRDDGVSGSYASVFVFGADLGLGIKAGTFINACFDLSMTRQNGSFVMMVSPALGISHVLGNHETEGSR